MKKVAILFGGVSAEHEVSVITGLQVLEQIDRDKYDPYGVYVDKTGLFWLQKIKTRKDFKQKGGALVSFAKDGKGAYLLVKTVPFSKKIYVDAAYLAFHGGIGESGPMQGFMETLQIPYTSSDTEGSSITMNKALTKEVLHKYKIETAKSINIFSEDAKADIGKSINQVKKNISLPVIIKPVHLGSSIGINVVHSEVELKKFLLEASHVDNEILIEEFLKDFTEYNCAVRSIDGKIETSEIERPINKDEILSFADKYQRGGKKNSGMASLARELPAKISNALKNEIQTLAKKIFVICRCKGMARIDFMVTKSGKLYVTEINPIPGSMAFYLWEASGITFTEQITDLIEQSIKDLETKSSFKLDYESDIIEKFVKSK